MPNFLSNDSLYGFYLEKKWWPSVEHYIEAKRCDKNQEEYIRNLSFHQLQRRISNAGSRYIDYNLKKKIKNAVREKFYYNSFLYDQLLKIDEEDIEGIDDITKREIINIKKECFKENLDNETFAVSFINLLFQICLKIRDMEMADMIYIDMVYDALGNIINLEEVYKEEIEDCSASKFLGICRQVCSKYGKYDEKIYKSIAKIMDWAIKTERELIILEKIKIFESALDKNSRYDFKRLNFYIKIPKGSRLYRDKITKDYIRI